MSKMLSEVNVMKDEAKEDSLAKTNLITRY